MLYDNLGQRNHRTREFRRPGDLPTTGHFCPIPLWSLLLQRNSPSILHPSPATESENRGLEERAGTFGRFLTWTHVEKHHKTSSTVSSVSADQQNGQRTFGWIGIIQGKWEESNTMRNLDKSLQRHTLEEYPSGFRTHTTTWWRKHSLLPPPLLIQTLSNTLLILWLALLPKKKNKASVVSMNPVMLELLVVWQIQRAGPDHPKDIVRVDASKVETKP